MRRRPPIVPLTGAQCHLLVPFQIFFWNAGVNVVWLDGLNINMPRDSNQASLLVFWSPDARSRLYLTNSALQSNSVTNSRGIFVQDAPAYIEGAPSFLLC